MSFIYVTGPAGSGKSAVQSELQKRGVDAQDEDSPGIGSAHNKQTDKPVSVPPVDGRSPQWFAEHEWRVLDDALDDMKDRAKEHVVVLCGNSLNKEQLDEIADIIIYLRVDDETLKQRVLGRSDNDYGKSEHEMQDILERKHAMDQQFVSSGCVIVDATKPLDEVVSEILDAANSTPNRGISGSI